jgi:glycosyltransferase involved in cell wall biosynthesis
MKVLIMTPIYPTPERPAVGTFVRTQVESLGQAGVEVEVLHLHGRFRKWNYAKVAFQLRRRLANDSIDLIHAHIGFAGMVARTQWKVPIVITFHGSDLLGLINARGRQALFSPLVVAAGKLLARHVDAAIVQNGKMATLLGNKPNVFVISCEIDLKTFQPTERSRARTFLGLDQNKKYLLFAANPQIAVKCFPLARAVAEELKRRDRSTELLVVYKEPQDRLALYMSACDALVLTSYQEGSPNIIKQALACNLPTVSTDVGDVRELIRDTKGCYVCDPDVETFVRRLQLILADRERTNGREKVQRLAGPFVARNIIRVYEQVLGKRACSMKEPGQTGVLIPDKREQ